jgi:hypothetical protein
MNNPATAIAIPEGDVAVLMGCSRLKPTSGLILAFFANAGIKRPPATMDSSGVLDLTFV